MKTLLILLLTISVSSAIDSPNGSYSAATKLDELKITSLVVKREDRTVFQLASGWGGFHAIQWSPDSKYLAVVDHGIKTMMILAVYRIEGDNVTKVDLPDYRLNILGRYKLVEGGRYWFDKSLTWKNASELSFKTTGSLKDGASNPSDDPDNWYSFGVVLSFENSRAKLLSVSAVK